MKSNTILLLIAIVFNLQWSVNANAQTACNRFGGNDIEYLYQLIETPDGKYVMTGRSYSFSGTSLPFDGDIYTIKLDSSLNLLWTMVFQTSAEDEGNAIANAHGGGYLVAGAVYDSPSGYDIALLMLDTGGAVLWSKRLGTPLNDQAEIIIPTSDDAYIIAGYSDTLFAGLSQSFVPFIAKIAENGSVLWARRFGFASGVFSGSAYDVIEASDGSYLVTGDIIRQFDGSEDSDIFLARLSSSGDLTWFKWIGINCPGCQEMGGSIVERSNGRFTLFGSSSVSASIYICDFDLNGNILLQSGLSIGSFAYAQISTVKVSNNHIAITFPAFSNIMAACIDSLHQVQWASLYGDGMNNIPGTILKKGSGFIIGAHSGYADPYREDYFVATLDSFGYSCCMVSEHPLTSSSLVLPDSSGGLAAILHLTESTLTGIATTGGVQRPVCTGYSAIEELTERVGVKAFPNPFTESINLHFSDDLPHTIRVFNSLGMLITECRAVVTIQIPAHSWPAGIYTVQAGNGESFRMVKVAVP